MKYVLSTEKYYGHHKLISFSVIVKPKRFSNTRVIFVIIQKSILQELELMCINLNQLYGRTLPLPADS